MWAYIYRNKKVTDSALYHQNSSNLKIYYTIFKNVSKFQQQLYVVEKVTGRRPKTLLKMSSLFLDIFLKF